MKTYEQLIAFMKKEIQEQADHEDDWCTGLHNVVSALNAAVKETGGDEVFVNKTALLKRIADIGTGV